MYVCMYEEWEGKCLLDYFRCKSWVVGKGGCNSCTVGRFKHTHTQARRHSIRICIYVASTHLNIVGYLCIDMHSRMGQRQQQSYTHHGTTNLAMYDKNLTLHNTAPHNLYCFFCVFFLYAKYYKFR